MRKYYDIVQDLQGNAISTATVTVYLSSSGAIASIFEDDETTAIANPFTVSSTAYDSDGTIGFKVANGVYDIKVVGSTTSWKTEVTISTGGSVIISEGEFCPNYGFTQTTSASITSVADLDLRALFSPGRRVKITDSTVKYGVVTSSTYSVGTVVNFTMEDAAIIVSNPTEVCLTSSTTAWVPIAADPFAGTAINAIEVGAIGATLYWIAVGDGGKLFYSTDLGDTWTAGTGFSTAEDLTCVSYDSDNRRFMVGGTAGYLLTSSTGTTWASEVNLATQISTGSGGVQSICWHSPSASWVVLMHKNTGVAGYATFSSTSASFGAAWSISDISSNATFMLNGSNSGVPVLIGNDSSDREDYTYWVSPSYSTAFLYFGTTGENNARCYAFRDNGNSTESVVYGRYGGEIHTSVTTVSSPTLDDLTFSTSNINAVVYAGAPLDRFIAVGDAGTLACIDYIDITIPDSWTLVSTGFSVLANISDIAATVSPSVMIVAVAQNGQICRSTTGIA